MISNTINDISTGSDDDFFDAKEEQEEEKKKDKKKKESFSLFNIKLNDKEENKNIKNESSDPIIPCLDNNMKIDLNEVVIKPIDSIIVPLQNSNNNENELLEYLNRKNSSRTNIIEENEISTFVSENEIKIMPLPSNHLINNDINIEEEKFIVKNKDTGEIYDIREMDKNPIDIYSFFPSNFERISILGQENESDHTTSGKTNKVKSRKKNKNNNNLLHFKDKFHLNKSKKIIKTDLNHPNATHLFTNKKDKKEFDGLYLSQIISKHNGPIWTMKFSHDGMRVATAGQDSLLRIWKINDIIDNILLNPIAEKTYQGHTAPIIDLSWSRSNFILSASMDKMVRLWHISREDCLHVFQHPDSIPAVDFHPKEDRFFLTGCFDNKIRIWDISEGRVVSYIQTPVMITSAAFNPLGNKAVAGLLNGQCIFYQLDSRQQLNYYTQIECRNSHGPLKNGKKVTGIQFCPEGKYFLVTTNDSRMRLYSIDNYSRTCKYKGMINDNLQIKGHFSQDGEYIICGSENGRICIWNTNKHDHLNTTNLLMGHKLDKNASYEYFDGTMNMVSTPDDYERNEEKIITETVDKNTNTTISSSSHQSSSPGIVTVAIFAPASTFALSKLAKRKIKENQDINKKQLQDDHETTMTSTHYILSASYDGKIRVFER